MIAAITLFSVMTLSITVIRVAAVALRLTGLPAETAKFQARSAFTGAGFTTAESEALVNHPLRRRVISLLMITGNIGLVSILATLVASLVNAADGRGGLLTQVLWLAGVMLAFWMVALNPLADRLMCGVIGRLLKWTGAFDERWPTTLVQLPSGYSLYRLRVGPGSPRGLDEIVADGWVVLGLRRDDGGYVSLPAATERVHNDNEIFFYSPDRLVRRLDPKLNVTLEADP